MILPAEGVGWGGVGSNFKHQNIQEAETASSSRASHTKRFEIKNITAWEFKFLFPKYLVLTSFVDDP